MAPLSISAIWANNRRIKFLIDLGIWALAIPVAFLLRFELGALQSLDEVVLVAGLALPLQAFAIYTFGLHRQSWGSVGFEDAQKVAAVGGLTTMLVFVEIWIHQAFGLYNLPRSIPLIQGAVATLAMGGARYAVRHWWAEQQGPFVPEGDLKRTLVVGAGDAGVTTIREIDRHPASEYDPVAFVDDDPNKQGLEYAGVPVVGTIDDIPDVVEAKDVDEILYAIPSESGTRRREAFDKAQEAGVPARAVPQMLNMLRSEEPGRFREAVEAFISRGTPQNVLVIGGAGYIGSALVEQLLERGFHVRVLDKLVYGVEPIEELLDHPSFELVEGDFRQVDNVVDAVQGMDAVVHLGAIVGDPSCALNEDITTEVNLMATKMIAQVAKGYGIRRFLFASTCSVYGAQNDEMIDETADLVPVSLYAETKLASENLLQEMADERFQPTVLRFGTVYGFSRRTRFDLVINLLTAKAVMDDEITLYGGDQWRPFVHVWDVARSIRHALTSPIQDAGNEVFNVGSDEQNYQLWDIADIIQSQIPSAEIKQVKQEHDGRNYRVSFAKIREALGFTPGKTVVDGIQQVKAAIDRGEIEDYENPMYTNIGFLSEEGVSEAIQHEFSSVEDRLDESELTNPLTAGADGD
jgi:nucleoside-diphosphate-sugar epimerase